MVFPTNLPSADASSTWGSLYYAWKRTEGQNEIYALLAETYPSTEIACNTVNNTWFDWDVHPNPKYVTEYVGTDGLTYVNLWNDESPSLFRFLKPTVADWISATGTEGTNSTSVSYIVDDNELRIVISPDEETTEVPGQTASGYRDTYYQLRKVSGTNFFEQIVHTKGWSTYHTIVPPSPGTYLLERVRTNPVEYHSFNSVEVTQAQLDSWHTANNGHIFYDPSENYLHYFIHSSEDTTSLLFGSAGRELFYRVRSVNQSVHNFNHLKNYDTNGTYRPTAHGIYHLERVLTNPSEVLSYAFAEVTQSQLNAWNLLNAPPGDDSGNNAPPNTPRGRRGNHNFW